MRRRFPGTDSIKWTVYLPAEMLAEILTEAERQGRPVGWMLREAVKIALPRIKAFNRVEP
jgi:uncharacterized small protein (TIGR04563 family)